VLEHKLGGVMFWDYSGDPTGILLGAINQSLRVGATEANSQQ
jgi:chitinase